MLDMAIFERTAALIIITLVTLCVGHTQSAVPEIVSEYWSWRESAEPLPADQDPVTAFEEKLRNDGLSQVAATATIEELRKGLVTEEGEFYDTIYAKGPDFDAKPNRLLVSAVDDRTPGEALDVGMGQGRNAVFLAKQGWSVTGFDPSAVGLEQARTSAAKAGVKIRVVQLGAEYFDFGWERWDLIAIIYPIEKFSIYRVRDALKPGGIVVVEAPHKETGQRPHHYESNELLDIFNGFRILRYDDTNAIADWGRKRIRLVRLIAEKPR